MRKLIMTDTNLTTPAHAKKLLDEVKAFIDAQAQDAINLRQHSISYPFAELSEQIQKRRKSQGMTLEDLSSLSEVSVMTLSKIERGNLNVNMETILKVTRALGMSLWVV
jgi:DNA-binding XRE family transcriptional regulator